MVPLRNFTVVLVSVLVSSVGVPMLGGCSGNIDETTPAPTLWPADVETLSADVTGNAWEPARPAAGSECQGDDHYTLHLKTRAFTSSRCALGATPLVPLKKVTSSRTLTSEETASVETAMKALALSKSDGCGADKPTLDLTVATAAEEKKYLDGFYKCLARSGSAGATYVDNIDGVFDALRKLAPMP